MKIANDSLPTIPQKRDRPKRIWDRNWKLRLTGKWVVCEKHRPDVWELNGVKFGSFLNVGVRVENPTPKVEHRKCWCKATVGHMDSPCIFCGYENE